VRRFRREAETAVGLRHPGITVVFDVDEADGRLFIVTELLQGQNLARVLEAHPGGIPVGRALGYGIEIAAALAYAHGRGIVHRDLKPLNLFVQDNGPLKVCDFGIARDLNAVSSLTTSPIGTPPYMARSSGRVSPPPLPLTCTHSAVSCTRC
jgi:serine/threonine protein kinase